MTTDLNANAVADLPSLVASIPGAVYRCLDTSERRMQYVSSGVEALCGYRSQALVLGMPHWGDIIHEDDRARVTRSIQQAVSVDAGFEIDYRIHTREGRVVWVCDRGRRSSAYGRTLLVDGFLIDLTERAYAQHRRRRAQASRADKDRLNSLGEMMSGIAHEINQPLAAISSYAESALRFIDQGSIKKHRLREALNKTIEETQRASSVVDRIRGLARTRVHTNELVDCNRLLTDICESIEPRAGAIGSHIELQLDPVSSCVKGDAIQLEHLILNLIRNAIEATESLGTTRGNKITVQSTQLDDRYIRIAVIDRGPGIDDARAEVLFRPFATYTNSRIELGLSVSRTIAQAHGGELSYHNNSGMGATFYVTLPVWRGRAEDDYSDTQ